jgi:hypothetical protein
MQFVPQRTGVPALTICPAIDVSDSASTNARNTFLRRLFMDKFL